MPRRQVRSPLHYSDAVPGWLHSLVLRLSRSSGNDGAVGCQGSGSGSGSGALGSNASGMTSTPYTATGRLSNKEHGSRQAALSRPCDSGRLSFARFSGPNASIGGTDATKRLDLPFFVFLRFRLIDSCSRLRIFIGTGRLTSGLPFCPRGRLNAPPQYLCLPMISPRGHQRRDRQHRADDIHEERDACVAESKLPAASI
jgi:hypothetical protein